MTGVFLLVVHRQKDGIMEHGRFDSTLLLIRRSCLLPVLRVNQVIWRFTPLFHKTFHRNLLIGAKSALTGLMQDFTVTIVDG